MASMRRRMEWNCDAVAHGITRPRVGCVGLMPYNTTLILYRNKLRISLTKQLFYAIIHLMRDIISMKEGIAVKYILNGTPIPYDLSINQLRQMMESPTMKDFALACEVLSCHKSHEAYEIMKGYINDKDKYRRLYILQTIFRHPEAVELTDFLEKAISSDDLSFVNNGLLAVANYKIKVSDSLLFSVITKHLSKLSYGALTALKGRGMSEENYLNLTKLFQKAEQCSQKEAIGEILFAKYLPAKAMELFDLFRRDTFAKIRLLALKIGNKYHYDISPFLSDTDGHVKKLAEAFLEDRL